MSHRTARLGGRFAALFFVVLLVTLAFIPAAALPIAIVVARPDGVGSATEMGTFTFPSVAPYDEFGDAVAVAGRWAVVGAPMHAEGTDSWVGRACALRWSPRGGWAYLNDLTVNDPSASDSAGAAVAASEDQLFVGVPYKRANGPSKMGGVVYVYEAGDASIEETLSFNTTDTVSGFGSAIAVDGTTMAIGSPYAAVSSTHSGCVYLFRKGAGWYANAWVSPPLPENEQYYGSAVALEGDDLIVGSPGYGAGDEGRVFTYHREPGGSWPGAGMQSLTTTASGDQFGTSVAVCDGIMVAGAPMRDTTAGADAGLVSVSRWTGSGWERIAELTSPAAAGSEYFGRAVALSEDSLLISAPRGVGSAGATSGVVYRYSLDPAHNGPPTYRDTLLAAVPSGADLFGSSLGFDGDTMLAGAPLYQLPVSHGGAAWFFSGMRSARCGVDSTLAVRAPGLLSNDFAHPGTMTASLESPPSHGVATVGADGSWTYDPTSWFMGTDTFRYRLDANVETRTATVTVEVTAPAARMSTAITIKRSASSVRRGRTLKLYGRLNPGALGDPCVVYVKKPGSHTWRKLVTRHASSITPNVGANWSYSLKPKSRGRYYFKVRFPGDANRKADWSPYLSVRVR